MIEARPVTVNTDTRTSVRGGICEIASVLRNRYRTALTLELRVLEPSPFGVH